MCRRVVDAADSLRIDWYNEEINKWNYERLEELFSEEKEHQSPEQYFDLLNFSILSPRDEIIENIKSLIKKNKEKVEAKRELLNRQNIAHQRPNRGHHLKISNFQPINSDLFENLKKEKDAINSVSRDVRHHIRLASDVLDSIKGNPESSSQITYSLFLVTMLFFVGVIYPLSFMPAASGVNFSISLSVSFTSLLTAKAAFLSAVSLIFCAILIMFFWLNMKLKYPNKTTQEIESYTYTSSYSKFFSNMDINRRLGAASHND